MSAAPLRRRAPARRSAPARPARPVRRAPAPARVLSRPGAVVLDRLLAGRLWIGLVFVLLVGIVFFNVDLLRMNRDIALTAQKGETIKRENARLRGELARLGSSERIQEVAAERGLVLPAPGEVRYLRAHPGQDARNALARLKAGSGQAAGAGVPPAQAEPGPVGGTAPSTGTPQATTTPQAQQPVSTAPQATAPQAATPTTTPQQTATPQATAPTTTTTGAGQ
jgi:cell division protein FtsL